MLNLFGVLLYMTVTYHWCNDFCDFILASFFCSMITEKGFVFIIENHS